MGSWLDHLRCDPLPALLSCKDQALQYFVKRDLLGEQADPIERLWELPEPRKILKKQQENGSWLRAGENKHPAINYQLVETWRYFRILVEKYGCTRVNCQARQAAEYLFSCQTQAGDFRGILANQYATYYTGAILSLLIQAGYTDDPRVEKCIRWLLSMRQDDGGWTIPILTHKLDGKTLYRLTSEYAEPLEALRSLPFSHNWTGMVLRAFAVHPVYRVSEEAKLAANLLKSRFFQEDSYTSYQSAAYWVRFEYPFWWNHLVSALDSIVRIGVNPGDKQIEKAVLWLINHQETSGLWRTTYAKDELRAMAKSEEMKFWVTLAICRVLKRLYG